MGFKKLVWLLVFFGVLVSGFAQILEISEISKADMVAFDGWEVGDKITLVKYDDSWDSCFRNRETDQELCMKMGSEGDLYAKELGDGSWKWGYERTGKVDLDKVVIYFSDIPFNQGFGFYMDDFKEAGIEYEWGDDNLTIFNPPMWLDPTLDLTEARSLIQQDVYTNQNDASNNQESATQVIIRSFDDVGTKKNTWAYYLINFTNISATSIDNATLYIYQYGKNTFGSGHNITLYYCNDSGWGESTIIWNNQATEVTECNATAFASSNDWDDVGEFKSYDLTDIITEELSDDKIFTIKVKMMPQDAGIVKEARMRPTEYATINERPYLNITYDSTPVLPSGPSGNVSYVTNLSTPIYQFSTGFYYLNLSWNDTLLNISSTDALFFWNGTVYDPSVVDSGVDFVNYIANVTHGLYNGTFETYWYYNWTNETNTTEVNTSVVNQTIARLYLINVTSLVSPIIETASAFYYFNLSWNSDLLNVSSVVPLFYFDGSSYSPSLVASGVNYSNYYVNIIHGLGNGTFETFWNYNYTLNGVDTSGNSSVVNQTISPMLLSGSAGNSSLWFRVYNQSSLDLVENVSFDTSCTYWYRTQSLNKNVTLNYGVGNNFTIYSSPAGYDLSASCDIYYSASGFDDQAYYLYNISVTDYQVNYSLYLSDDEATSFLVTYQDENYLYVPNVTVDVWRYYPSLGSWVSVEKGVTDFNGMTVVHLITETVDYKFKVWDEDDLIYSSPEYRALCLDTPCQINLRADQSLDTNVSVYNEVAYTYEVNKSARSVQFVFSVLDGSSSDFNMTVYMDDGYDNETAFSSSLVASGGSLSGVVPIGMSNTTYNVFIWRDGELFGYDSFSLSPSASDTFGVTGLFMSGLLFLTLGLMTLSSGIAVIVFGLLGLVMATLLVVFTGGATFGLSSFMIWLLVAGAILIWKISQRGVN